MRPRPSPDRPEWNVLTRRVQAWHVALDGVEHEVTLVQRIELFGDVLRRDRTLPTRAIQDGSRLALVAPRARTDVLVDGRSHTGSPWGPPNPLARERAFRIFGHRGVVRIKPRPGLPPDCMLFVDDVLVAPGRRPRRRAGLRRVARPLVGAALAALAMVLLAVGVRGG